MKIGSSVADQLGQTTNKLNSTNEKLASGKRVNSAADDAAGLQIIDRLTAQQNGYVQASRNAYDGISYSQVADSALAGVNGAVARIRELSIQAGNGALNDSDRAALQEEVGQLQSQIGETLKNTTFGGKEIFNGEQVSFQIGADAVTTQSVAPADTSFVAGINSIDISTQAGAQSAIQAADDASKSVNQQRTQLGAFENTLSSTIRGLGTQRENIAASQSRIQDADYAREVSQQTANDILAKASIAIRGQANQNAASVLGLL